MFCGRVVGENADRCGKLHGLTSQQTEIASFYVRDAHEQRESSQSNRGRVTGLALVMGGRSFSVSSSRVKRQIRVATEREVIASQRSGTHELSSDRGIRRWAIGLTSLSFTVLQSVCTLVMALSGVRMMIGLGALAAVAAGAKAPATGFHQDGVRIPMMVVAVLGACLNLCMIWRIRSLRSRPSSQWRQQPITRRRLWGERLQIILAVITLFLVLAEFLSHRYIFRLVG